MVITYLYFLNIYVKCFTCTYVHYESFLFKLNLSEEKLTEFYAYSQGQNISNFSSFWRVIPQAGRNWSLFCLHTQNISALSLYNSRLTEIRVLAPLNFTRCTEQPIFEGYNAFFGDYFYNQPAIPAAPYWSW